MKRTPAPTSPFSQMTDATSSDRKLQGACALARSIRSVGSSTKSSKASGPATRLLKEALDSCRGARRRASSPVRTGQPLRQLNRRALRSSAGLSSLSVGVPYGKTRHLHKGSGCRYLLVAPQILITAVFFFWPAGQAIYQSALLYPTRSGSQDAISLGLGTSNFCFERPVLPRIVRHNGDFLDPGDSVVSMSFALVARGAGRPR
jgi:hypothetical protein